MIELKDLFPKDIEMNADALNNNNKMVSIERDGEPHTLRLFAESNFRSVSNLYQINYFCDDMLFESYLAYHI